MARAKIVPYRETNQIYGISFECPGCALLRNQNGGLLVLPVSWTPPGMEPSPDTSHPRWTFNGDLERPTFSPSVLSRWDEWQGHDAPPKHQVCHSFIRDGRIQFLGDCTHDRAGKTVDLPEMV